MKSSSSKVQKVMKEFKTGKLHSGSKKGPVVKSRKQAVAIAMSEAGKSMGQAPMVPGGIAAPMKKGGSAKKPKMGIAIMIAVGKKKGK